MEWIVTTFRQYPELAIFATLAAGYWVGNLLLTIRGMAIVLLLR